MRSCAEHRSVVATAVVDSAARRAAADILTQQQLSDAFAKKIVLVQKMADEESEGRGRTPSRRTKPIRI